MDAEGAGAFRRIALVGLGVMGGSLARALGALRHPPTRVGWSPLRREALEARSQGALDEAPERLEVAIADADLVVLAAPLGATVRLMDTLGERLRGDGVVTDVASLKAPVARAASAAGLDARWVGSHPLCGSAESGFGASSTDLYRGARVYLVAHASAEAALEGVAALWRTLGAIPERVDAAAHDASMAAVSHLPQLTANALAAVLSAAAVAPGALGPGGADMTRLAVSSPEMWRDILAAEAGVGTHLRALSRALDVIAGDLDAGDLDAVTALMRRTRDWRRGS